MKAKVHGREVQVEIGTYAPGRLIARLDGEDIEADARRTADGAWSILIGGRSYELFVEDPTGNAAGCGESVRVAMRGRVDAVRLEDPRRRRAAATGLVEHDGWAEVRAPMPGKVVAVLVSEGDGVEAGQGLVIVEAMKMENEYRSPKKGTVVQVPVAPGQAVEAGQVLVAIE